MTVQGALIFIGLWAALIVLWGLDRPSPRSAYARLRPRSSPRPDAPPGQSARAGDPDRDSAPAVNGSPACAARKAGAMTYRRRLRLTWLRLRGDYYAQRYGRPMRGISGGMLPQFGDGRYVAVHQRGPFLEMHDKRTGDLIRLVPYQPNHGVMVEMWRNGKLAWRGHCDFNTFQRMGFDQSERAA